MSELSLYLKYVSMTIKSQLEYRASFIFMSLGHFTITFIEFVGMYSLFLRFNQINGWQIYEVSLFYGLINISFACAEAIGRGFDIFHNYVRAGTFDRILTRPRSLVFQVISSEFQIMRVGRLIQGILVLVWGLMNINVHLGAVDYILLVYSCISSIVFFIALMIFQATLSFFSVESLEIMNSFTYGGVQTAQYPLDIYKKWFQKIFIYLIPIGSVNYFPIAAILNRSSYLLGFLTPLIGFVFFALSILSFNLGTRYYCSTGS